MPPPPQVVPAYPGVYPVSENQGLQLKLKTSAKLKKQQGRTKNQGGSNENAGAPAAAQEEKAVQGSRPPASSQDSDFLLDWASVKKKESK